MSDFKINTAEVLMTILNIKQFSYECLHGNPKEVNQKIFELAAQHMPVTEINKGVYFRTRKIEDKDGEETGIIRKNGIPVTGYNVSYSSVAPIKYIKENGRVNHAGERVLYLSEDMVTSCKENKPQNNEYLSVAECHIEKNIQAVDFTYSTENGLEKIFPEDVRLLFESEYGIDIRAFYMCIKQYLTAPDYKNNEYIIPLTFLDKIKKRKDISGIRYISFFTKRYNIALWDANKNLPCINSKVAQNDKYL